MQEESPSDDTPLVDACPDADLIPAWSFRRRAGVLSAPVCARIILGGLFATALLFSCLSIIHRVNERLVDSEALAAVVAVVVKEKRAWKSFGRNTACRLDSTDSTTDGAGTVQVARSADLAACKLLCQTHDSCSGVEFNQNDERCEMWTKSILHTAAANGFECFSFTEQDKTTDSHVERHTKNVCELPPRAVAAPSIFCWTVMMPDSAEQALVAAQLKGVAGIFACNDYAVVSRKKVWLGKDECGDDVNTWLVDMPAKLEKGKGGPNGLTSSWLNAGVFQDVWGSLMSSDRIWQHKFVAKADPDSVLFPDRLRASLQSQHGMAYFTNCRFWSGDMVGKLYGSLEVVSHDALMLYHRHKSTCWNLQWHLWGEDLWLQKCMEALKVPVDTRLISKIDDDYCSSEHWGEPGACTGWDKVSFHPHKDAGSWWSCWKQAGR